MKRRALLAMFAIVVPLLAQEAKKEATPAGVSRTEPNIEMTVYLMAGLAEASQQSSLPKELDRVAKQLKTVFAYQGFSVLDTVILRVRNGDNASVDGVAPTPGSGEVAPYRVQFGRVMLAADEKGMWCALP